MKRILKNIAYAAVSMLPAKGAVVLMYHSVGENGKFFTVTPSEFEKQMRYLHENHFSVLSLEEAVSLMQKNNLPAKAVVITFDDGYEDNYAWAFPVLKKYRFLAAIFINTSVIGKQADILSEQEMKEMAQNGLIAFGSHAHRHVKLAQLPDEEIESELLTSKKILEGIVGAPVKIFAYPYGSFDERVQKIVAKYFALACGVEKGRVKPSSDILLIPRNSVDSKVTFMQFKGIVRFGRI